MVSPPLLLNGKQVVNESSETWMFCEQLPSESTVTLLGGIALLNVISIESVVETPVDSFEGSIVSTVGVDVSSPSVSSVPGVHALKGKRRSTTPRRIHHLKPCLRDQSMAFSNLEGKSDSKLVKMCCSGTDPLVFQFPSGM